MILAPLGTSGLWSLSAPFNVMLKAGTPYTVIGIRNIAEIIAAGDDPETDYYTSNNLTTAVYLNDLNNNVSILSLQNGAGDLVYVPNSFVNNYPDLGGVPYRVLALTINLGAIPDAMSLSNLISKVQDDVLELVGINAIAKVAALSPVTLLNSGYAASIEAARVAKVGTVITDYTKYVQTNLLLTNARQKISMLEALLKKLHSNGVQFPIVPMTPYEVSTLSTSEVAALNTNVIASLTSLQINALTVESIQALTTTQLEAFTTSELSALNTIQVVALTTSQMAALTTNQIAALPPII